MTNDKEIRTRFAPSPTGMMHIGNLRTALFAYLYAKHNKGKFILRIEDTDRARFVEGAIEQIISILGRFGMDYDEGVTINNGTLGYKGDFGPYLQSERLNTYKEYADQLVEQGHAYYCFCTEERLAELRKQQEAMKLAPMYDRKCKSLSKEQVKANLDSGMKYVIRQAIPEEGKTTVKDLVYGEVTWENRLIDDQVLVKSDGFPTYFLAVVVDDHLMGITHVVRGEEWLPSTPKHILLYEAFGWEAPSFVHLPVILNQNRSKMSKRQGDVSVNDFIKKGYLEEAIINFLALLGWNPKTEKEVFSLQELIEQFDFDKVNKAGAVFDTEKLDWINGLYIRAMETSKLTDLIIPYLLEQGLITGKENDKDFTAKSGKAVSRDYISKVVLLEKERLKKLSDIGDRVPYFFEYPTYQPQMLIWRKSNLEQTRANISELITTLQSFSENDFATKESFEQKIKEFISSKSLDNGSVLWPLRVALSGLEFSPSPFEIAETLNFAYGKFEILQRLETALKSLA